MITKEQFVKLAEAYVIEYRYECEILGSIRTLAKKYNKCTDFLGLPTTYDQLFNAVADLLGDDFSYFLFECDGDFNEFNDRITLKDGTHPKVYNFADLYDFAVAEESIK